MAIMYYKLKASTGAACMAAYWDADFLGLDPYYLENHTFELGTGNIEKVSTLISKHKLDILVESEHEPTGYKFDRR